MGNSARAVNNKSTSKGDHKVSFTDVNMVHEFKVNQQNFSQVPTQFSKNKFQNKQNSNNFSTRSNNQSSKNKKTSPSSIQVQFQSSKNSLDSHRKNAFSDIKSHLQKTTPAGIKSPKTSPKTSPSSPKDNRK